MDVRSTFKGALDAVYKLGNEKYRRPSDKIIEYGTAGFRTRASELDHVIYRMGLLSVLRSKVKKATIGVMITASHNPEEDNGVKLVDPDGEMLETSWESYATLLANVSDDRLIESLLSIAESAAVDLMQSANVIFARDTRPSSHRLSQALNEAITAFGGDCTDFGLLTTPQLHYLVRCVNSHGIYGQPTESGYYKKLAEAFVWLNERAGGCTLYKPHLWIDGANGIGSLKMKEMMKHISSSSSGLLEVEIFNDGATGKLNHKCGADFVKVQQSAPHGSPADAAGLRCASFDGDADRIVYYFIDNSGHFQLLDGDKIATLIANYISELLREIGIASITIGVIQTAYANGASTSFINNVAKVPVVCVPTGVKHLHHKAQEFDIGVYFEANGHGTVLFQDFAVDRVKQFAEDDGNKESVRQAARRLLYTVDLINQTVGDAISDLLVVETILRYRDWDAETWHRTYTDLPNRQLKVKVKDRSLIKTTDAERRMTSPEGLQQLIDSIISKFSQARSFVRPSGTEDAVRVYAEADTQDNADLLAYEVSTAIYDGAGGVGDRPIPPPVVTSTVLRAN